MNPPTQPIEQFERRRSNRAILILIAMTLAGMALNDDVPSLIAETRASSRLVRRLVSDADQEARAVAARMAGLRQDHCHASAYGHDSVAR